MTYDEIERDIECVAASFHFEGLEIDAEDKENGRRLLCGEIAGDQLVEEIVQKHGYRKMASHAS